jgi:hypothetical protein
MTTNYGDESPPLHSIRAADALRYAVAKLTSCTDWACDSIAGSLCDHGGHEDELDAINAVAAFIQGLAARFGELNRYSDGRLVKTQREVEEDSGLRVEHIWEPNPYAEEPSSWRGNLHSGHPDIASPGVYEVSTSPLTQELHIRVLTLRPLAEVRAEAITLYELEHPEWCIDDDSDAGDV